MKIHSNDFIKSDNSDSAFEIYIKKEVTINKLKGNVKLFVPNSIVEKIEFESEARFMGSVNIAQSIFDDMLE